MQSQLTGSANLIFNQLALHKFYKAEMPKLQSQTMHVHTFPYKMYCGFNLCLKKLYPLKPPLKILIA